VWVGFTLVVIAAIWLFRPILLPFIIGIALAYILNPLVNIVQRARVSRGLATAIVVFGVLGVIIGLFVMITPLIATQMAGLIARLPGYIGDLQSLVRSFAPQLIEWLGPQRAAQLETSLAQFLGSGMELIGSLTGQLAQGGLTFLSTLAVLIVAPVVTFYLLLDWEGMVKGIDDLLPREHRAEISSVLNQIDRSIAGVIRGQGSVILVLCIYYATGLSLTGLNYGLVVGLMTGLLSFVPYLGFLIGLVLSVGLALVQFAPNWWLVVVVFMIYMIGQFIEGNVLYPKLVGQSININPVWLMFALFAFGFLFGFVGFLLAVPLAAIAATLARYAISRYKDSSLYRGHSDTAMAGQPELALEAPTVAEKRLARRTTAKK
jgi:predicted PurR-regulated permease PerM